MVPGEPRPIGHVRGALKLAAPPGRAERLLLGGHFGGLQPEALRPSTDTDGG